ncbi:unnamed protein product, partial [Phaeothamnion confervicola]
GEREGAGGFGGGGAAAGVVGAGAGPARKNVVFGSPAAAVFNLESPSNKLTPMPSRQAKERFTLDGQKKKKGEEKEESDEDEETASNSAMLDAWE